MRLPPRRTGRGMRSYNWLRITHLQSWYISKFSCVSIYHTPPFDIPTVNPGRNDRHSTEFISLSFVDGSPLRKSISQGNVHEDLCGARVGHFRCSWMVIQEQVRTPINCRNFFLTYRKGRYSLTTHSTVELQTYITNTFPNDILHCTVCHKTVFHGIRCYTRNYKGTLCGHCYAT